VPEPGAAVAVDGEPVGEVTRAATSPALDTPVALAFVDYDLDADAVTVGGEVDATVASLPFVEGSDRSARLPVYPA
jgi:aminomethyltransferase